MNEPRPGLPDGCGFWLAAAAACAALGGIGMAIAVAEYHPPWTSAWFIAGAAVCAFGCASAIWAWVLYMAHKEAEKHWCPNLRAHVPEAYQLKLAVDEPAIQTEGGTVVKARAVLRAIDAVSRGDLARWLRPVLREMNGDLRQAEAGIKTAHHERKFVGLRHEFDLGRTWEDNRQRFAALEGRGYLYDTLRDAYTGIAKVHRIASLPDTAPDDVTDLLGVLEVIVRAEVAVGKELAELG